MKKIYLSLLGLGLSIAGVNAQVEMKPHTFGEVKQNPNETHIAPAAASQKVLLWSEDFSGIGTPPASTAGPSFTTSNGTWTTAGSEGNVWKHSFYTTSGEWSGGTGAFMSTTAADGFMLFDSDSVNFVTSPTYNNLSGDLISPPIDLSASASAMIVMEQDFRYCCTGTAPVSVSVSSDGGMTWSAPYDLSGGAATNNDYFTTAGTYDVSANITPDAANSIILLKFSWDGFNSGNSHYYWTIDDIEIHTANTNDIVATLPYWGSVGLHYFQIPIEQIAPIDFSTIAYNNGLATQNNVTLSVDVDGGATFAGTSASSNIAPATSDSLFTTTQFTPNATVGTHSIDWMVSQDEVDDTPADNALTSIALNVTDFIYARDMGVDDGGTYNQGFEYEVGNLFDIFTDATIYAIDAMPRGSSEDLSQMWAKLYSIDPTTGDFILEEQSDYYEINSGNVDQIVRMDLLNPFTLTAGETYLVVAGSDGDGGATNDFVCVTSGASDPQTSFYYDGTDLTWYYTTSTPIVRMNFEPLGLEENEFISNVSVHPNPVENDLNVSYSLLNASDVTVTVVDLTGKVVSTQTVSSQTEGAHKLNVNTASFANGLYTVTIESVDSVVSRKFVKK